MMICSITPRELWTCKNIEKKVSHIIVKRGKETSKGKYVVASICTTGKKLLAVQTSRYSYCQLKAYQTCKQKTATTAIYLTSIHSIIPSLFSLLDTHSPLCRISHSTFFPQPWQLSEYKVWHHHQSKAEQKKIVDCSGCDMNITFDAWKSVSWALMLRWWQYFTGSNGRKMEEDLVVIIIEQKKSGGDGLLLPRWMTSIKSTPQHCLHGASWFHLRFSICSEFLTERQSPRTAHETTHSPTDAWSWASLSVTILSFHLSTYFQAGIRSENKLTVFIVSQLTHLPPFNNLQSITHTNEPSLRNACLFAIASNDSVGTIRIFTRVTMKLSIALLSLTAGASAFTAPLQTRWVTQKLCAEICARVVGVLDLVSRWVVLMRHPLRSNDGNWGCLNKEDNKWIRTVEINQRSSRNLVHPVDSSATHQQQSQKNSLALPEANQPTN